MADFRETPMRTCGRAWLFFVLTKKHRIDGNGTHLPSPYGRRFASCEVRFEYQTELWQRLATKEVVFAEKEGEHWPRVCIFHVRLECMRHEARSALSAKPRVSRAR